MSQRIKVDLAFNADTTAAINNITQLNQLLTRIGQQTKIGVDDGPLMRASQSAQELQMHLQKAVNVETGKIDLSKLSASLKSSNTDLQTLATNLRAAGPAGQQAFLKVATAIASAETPLIRVNQRLKDFGTTLLNTVKWQIASTAIHGISGMLTSAVSHAENLNVALNDIRIVTGYSTDEMAKFAMQASEAARQLSTTTTEYSKAALIFYQQGLKGSEVTERADVVVKLSQVTGQSAEQVSSQMTAIWNNFDDGSKSLEYYADALARLGAETAASTDEIAAGLEKFAAVSETVGLSYEYAAASVATVVDKTRQSADVVGTAFKTIFARMQGLSLGETLEDGVDLNKYSEALEKVGVNVLDASGQLRDMDDILDDLGAKWQGFGRETQTALAQVIGGARQYNQMMSLMNNWDAVIDNVDKAKEATGELTKQQSIWSESYTAAANRVKQAQNDLYKKFIDDEAIVKLTDMFAGLIDGVSGFIDSMGGVGPMVLMLVAIFSKQLFPMIQAGFVSLKNNIAVLTGKAQQDIIRIQNNAKQALNQMMNDSNMTEGQRQSIEVAQKLLNAKQELTLASKHMSQAQLAEAQARMQNYEAISAQTQATLEKKAALEEELKVMKEQMNTGSTKREVAKVAAFDSFRSSQDEDSDIDADAVIEDADSRSMASVKAELDSLPKTADIESRKFELKQKIASAQQSINDLEENYANTSSKNVERQEETLAKIESQKSKLAELQEELAHVGEEDEERRKHLTAVLDLQKKIVEETKKDISDISVGKVQSSALSDMSYGQGEEVASLEKGMAGQITSTLKGTEINGTDTSVGEIVSEASLGNLEKLYTLMGQYKQQLSEVKALGDDFSAEIIQEEIKAKDNLANAENDLAKAKKKQTDIAKNQGKNSQAAKKAAEEVAKAEEKYAKALKESEKASKKTKKAGIDYQKTLNATKTKVQELYKSIKGDAAQKDIEELDQAFEALGKGDSQAAMDTIVSKMKNLQTALRETGDSADMMGADMVAALQGGGFKPEQINAMIDRLQKLGIISAETAQQLRVLEDSGNKIVGDGPSKAALFAGKITTLGTVAGTVAMSISALSGTINTMMNPDATGMEKAISLLMTLSTLLPTVAGAITFLNGVMKAKNALEAEGTAITGASIGAQLVEMGVISAKTAATWGNTLANLANLLSNPFTMALAAVAIAAIAGVCIWLSSKTAATERMTEAQLEQNKADMEASEKATELASKWAEQQEAMDGLIKKYKELKAAGDDYSGTVEDIIAAVPDLIEAYHAAAEGVGIDVGEGSEFAGIEQRMKNAAAVGDVEAVEAAQNEMDTLISPAAAEAAEKGYTAAVNTLATTLTQTQGSINGNTYSVDVGGADNIFDEGNEEAKAWEYVAAAMGDNATEGKRNFWGKYGGTISMDMGTNDEFMSDYENLMKARDDMLANMTADEIADSDVYREIDELLKNTEEQYTKAKEMQAEANKYGVYDAKARLEEAGMDLTEISSLEEYEAYKEALLNDSAVKGDPEAEKIAQQWLEANACVQEYVKAEQKIGYVRDQAGDGVADALKEMYDDELTPEQQKLFLEVDFTKYQSEEAVRAEIDRLQAVADMEAIEVKITAISTAQDSLKESGMTEDDWMAVRDSGIEWGKDGVMQFTEFLAMSYEEQSKYLTQIKGVQEELLGNATEESITSLQSGLEALDAAWANGTYEGTEERYQAEREAIQENIQLLEGELAIRQKIAESKEIESYGLDATLVQEMKEAFNAVNSELQIFNENTGEFENAALSMEDLNEANKDAAIRYVRLNEAVDDLNSNYDTYNTLLEDLADATDDVDKAMIANSKDGKALQKSLAGLLGTTEDFIDADLLAAIDPDDFKKAAEGDEDAINRIREAFIRLQTEGIEGVDVDALLEELSQLEEGIVVDISADSMPMLYELIAAKVAAGAGAAEIEALLSGFNIDADVSDFVGSMDEMAAASADAASEVIANTSFSQEVEPTTVETPTTEEEVSYSTSYTPETVTSESQVMKNGADEPVTITESRTNWNKEVTSEVVPTETTDTTVGTSVTTSNAAGETGQVKGVQIKNAHKSSGGGVSSNRQGRTAGGGGGGGSSKKAEPTKKRDVVDRYKQVDDKLDDQARQMDKASKAADRLWGKARVDAMKKVNEALETNIDLLKAKRKEAQDNLAEDTDELQSVLSEQAGMSATFDSQGNISNYDTIMNSLYDELSAAETKAGDEWDEDEQEEIDAIQERIDKVKEAIENYDETKELIQDLDEEIQNAIYEWQDNNYEILNLELEWKLDVNEKKLELIDYYLSKVEDDIYATAEAFSLLSQQVDIYSSNLAAQDEYAKQLEEDYYAGKISLEAYKEGLANVQTATIENLQSLQQSKEALQDYYGNVLSMALEEIAIYTDEMENLNSVLDHYSNIMDIVGKKEDFASRKKILTSKANNLKNEAEVQSKIYEESNAEAMKWAQKMTEVAEGSNEYETYKKNWLAAQEAANEAQDAMLSKTEEWAEAMKSLIETEFEELADIMEKSLTGGTSFDELLTSMERRSSLQEEYLTTTNQIYETNKMMRAAQQEIDKTSNTVAKKRLQGFIEETNQLQGKNKLSQYELDIQQAKYDLLLAEIALEEAQSAKSTVRLQRDAEGNFGYVYTADQNAVDDAEQKLADAQNNLYNIGLDGANDYQQKYAETLQEAQDAITELTQMWMNGEIASEEEFNRRKQEIVEYYGEKLQQYSDLHSIALTTDSRVVQEAWSSDFIDMTASVEEWHTSVNEYFEGASVCMQEWSGVCAEVLENSGLDDLDTALGDIDSKSQDLKETLIGEDGESGVVGALMAEAEAAGTLSEAYIGVQNEIDNLIDKYEKLLEKVNADYTNPDTPAVDPAIDPDEEEEEEDPPVDPDPPETPAAEGPTYHTGTLSFTGNGADRVWKDAAGNTYKYGSAEQKAMQKAFDKAYGANGGYKGDYWQGWTNNGAKLNAAVLHEKYGLATGGYTGDWAGSFGKLAFLHQKELVLNAGDTENFLASMELLDRIISAIDLQSANSALGGLLRTPAFGGMNNDSAPLEQNVHIEASFPGVSDRNEIEEAFNNLVNQAAQYANRI